MSQNKKSPITFEQEELLWEKKHFNLDSSTGLIHAVIFYLIKCFGVWQGKYLKMLTTEHVKFGEDEQGKYISIDTKAIVGVGKIIKRYDDPGNPRSVYKIFKIYHGYLANEGPFLLRPITSIKDYVCYSPWALGVGIINQTVRNLMSEIGDGQPYANSSVSLFALDMLKGTGIGSHCIMTWTQHLCLSHMKFYLNDIFESCSVANCEDKNKELCLLVSRVLDPLYPCTSLMEERIKVARELKKNKINSYDSWLENISTKFSGDEESMFQNMEELPENAPLKKKSCSSSKVKANSQHCSPSKTKGQNSDITIKSEVLDLETDIGLSVKEDPDNNEALSHDSWLKIISTDDKDEDVIYQKTEELSEKESRSSTKAGGSLKNHPPIKKVKSQTINVKRGSADGGSSLNTTTAHQTVTNTPKLKESHSTNVKITSVSSIPESSFSVQVDGEGESVLNKSANSKNTFKFKNMNTGKDLVEREGNKPNQTMFDQCSVKLEEIEEEWLPSTSIKEEVMETSDGENFEMETSLDSKLEIVTAPAVLADTSGSETQANDIVNDIIYPTDSLPMPTSPIKGLLNETATSSLSEHLADTNLDTFQMLKTIIKQEKEDSFDDINDSPTTSCGEGPPEEDCSIEQDTSCGVTEQTTAPNVNMILNSTTILPSPQSSGEEVNPETLSDTLSKTEQCQSLFQEENAMSTSVDGTHTVFDLSPEKSPQNVNKSKRSMTKNRVSSAERGSSKKKMKQTPPPPTCCNCLHTCHVTEKPPPRPPPNFLSCPCKTWQSKENSCHSSVFEDSSDLLGRSSKSTPVVKSNSEPKTQETKVNAFKRSISDSSSQNARKLKSSKSKMTSQTRNSLKNISEFSKAKSKLFWRYRQKRLRSLKKQCAPQPTSSSSSPLWPFSSSTLVNSMGARLKPCSGIYHFRSDRHEHAAYQTLQIQKEKRSQMFLIGDISLDNYTKRDNPGEHSTIGVTTSEISIGDYFPKDTVIPASGLKLFTKYGPDGLEVILKFDFSENNTSSST